MGHYQYVFGPVPSRRLGRSLGVNPIPLKTCNYSCVYCQLGRTSRLVGVREDFFPPGDILEEIRRGLAAHPEGVDYVTFVGEGEPTLCKSLGMLIEGVKGMAAAPVAVITNGSLLGQEAVRRELARADVVMPSLDAVDPAVFRKTNRPVRGLRVGDIVDGMVAFREIFRGQLWIEVMLVRGLNDREEQLLELRGTLERIAPDRVYLNVPIRPPAESWVEPPLTESLVRAHALLEGAVVIDQPEAGEFDTAGFGDPAEAVAMIVRRHPMRREQIAATLAPLAVEDVERVLRNLVDTGRVQEVEYRGSVYYAVGKKPRASNLPIPIAGLSGRQRS